MVGKSRNNCCALSQMYASNSDSIEDIRHFIESQKAESKAFGNKYRNESDFMVPATGGDRAFFCITTPNEPILEENLEKAGFRYLTSFKRRYCYEDHETAVLKMWIINW